MLGTLRDNLARRFKRTGTKRTLAEPIQERKRLTAFVLLGGGAHGASQSGALTELIHSGIIPDVIVGVSAGAWNGAFWACDPTLERANMLEAIWTATTTADILGTIPWRAAMSAVTNRGGLYEVDGLQRLAERHLGSLTFEDARLPLRILAINLTRGEPFIFKAGSLTRAILASAAIPGIFPPVIIEKEYYVDGGLIDDAAIDAALAFGASRIYLISCGVKVGHDSNLESITGLIERAWEVMGLYDFRNLVDKAKRAGVEIIPIQPEIPQLSILNFNQAKLLLDAGHAAARDALARIEKPAN
jgi:NTE family protein